VILALPAYGCNPDYPRLIGLNLPSSASRTACSAAIAALWDATPPSSKLQVEGSRHVVVS
jgi:hypothetical protein